MSAGIPITPETKVADLLETYPELEEVLVGLSPHFKALKNPILRKTVAKVATLEKAAKMGSLPLRTLIVSLRQAVGQPIGDLGAADQAEAPPAPAGPPPAWLDEAQVRERIDADQLLEAGEHPMGRVQRAVQALEGDELVLVLSAFRPVPLVEILERGGHRVHVAEAGDGKFRTYIARGV